MRTRNLMQLRSWSLAFLMLPAMLAGTGCDNDEDEDSTTGTETGTSDPTGSNESGSTDSTMTSGTDSSSETSSETDSNSTSGTGNTDSTTDSTTSDTDSSTDTDTTTDPVESCQDKACDTPCQLEGDSTQANGVCNVAGKCIALDEAHACYEQCIPGSSFDAPDGCNTCTCGDDGLIANAACTEKACEACESNSDCGQDQVCNFGNNQCGIWEGEGACVAKPETCDTGGPGYCSCDGRYVLNECEAHMAGTDVMRYGGCDLPDVENFMCGNSTCLNNQYCIITSNDVAGPGQPEYYESCADIPKECSGPARCDCVPTDDLTECFEHENHVILFYPGG